MVHKRLVYLCKGNEVGTIKEGNAGDVPRSMLVQSPGYVCYIINKWLALHCMVMVTKGYR
jgi:uncharacterized protein CbrC (UPF0167 family)